MMEADKYKVPILVYVPDNNTETDYEKELINNLMQESYAEVLAEKKQIYFTRASREDFTEDMALMLNKTKAPFMFLIEAQKVDKPYLHIFPGKSCYECVEASKIESAAQITTFIMKYFKGQLFPMMKNENLTESFAEGYPQLPELMINSTDNSTEEFNKTAYLISIGREHNHTFSECFGSLHSITPINS